MVVSSAADPNTQKRTNLVVRSIACGLFVTFFVVQDGALFGMGNNECGQMASQNVQIKADQPVRIGELSVS